MASLQQHDISLRTDVLDPLDQAHNSMNLSLGKPTQSFAQPAAAKKRNLEKLYGPKYLGKLNEKSVKKQHHTLQEDSIYSPREQMENHHATATK